MLTKKSLLKAVRKEYMKSPVDLKDLISCSGEQFIDNAFKLVLNREPDLIGKRLYLSKLRKGELTKKDIIIILRYSDEGKKADVKIIGLRRFILLDSYFLKSTFKKTAKKLKFAMSSLICSRHPKTTTEFIDFSTNEYAEFEECFRGKEQDIKKRLNIYTPLVFDLLEKSKTELIKAVDCGCGRGEWLEIMREQGVSALGVEINDVFLNRLKNKGIDAEKADVFEFLKATEDNSFHIVTAFHLIEHIEINLRVTFLREILRVLKKDGICILETPNPRNILVGSGDFYRDPTHVTPLFPDTLQFIGKTIGFSDSVCFFLEKEGLVEIDNYSFDSLEDYVSVSRDFAWVGKKDKEV
jgi:2-polyprenyl-3-methyl-5-hydroxy-6-metoxy-1,4-benzoquinol methylase